MNVYEIAGTWLSVSMLLYSNISVIHFLRVALQVTIVLGAQIFVIVMSSE
jgi:hypothetical protein